VRAIFAITRRELRSYFSSPIAYAVLTVFLFLTGWYFDLLVGTFLQMDFAAMRLAQAGQRPPPLNLNEVIVRGYFGFVLFFLPLLLAPALTMRLFAEEKRQGTMELLLTSPITDLEIVLGKYLAALALVALMLLGTAVHIGFLYLWGQPDTGPILAGYLGLFLVGAAYLALGLLVSSLTENQIVAAVTTVAVNLLFFLIGFSAQLVGEGLGKVFEYASVITHFDDFQKGIIDSRDILYFVTLAGLGIFLTLRSVESLRWKG
jgi:ABC-2 type transport system permease protein